MRARRDHRGDYNCHGFGEIFGNFRLAICMQPHLIRLARSEGSRQGSCVCLPCERDTREIVSRYDHYESRTCCCQTVAGKIFFDNAPTPVTRSSMRGGRHPSPTRGNNTHYHISLSYTTTFNREGGWAQEHSGETRIRSDHHRDRGETTVRWKMRARRDHRGDYNCHGFGEIFGNFRLAICMQPHLIRLARSEGSRQGSCVCLPCERDTREIVSRYDHYESRTCCCQTVAGKIFFDNAPTPVTRSSMRGGRHPSPVGSAGEPPVKGRAGGKPSKVEDPETERRRLAMCSAHAEAQGLNNAPGNRNHSHCNVPSRDRRRRERREPKPYVYQDCSRHSRAPPPATRVRPPSPDVVRGAQPPQPRPPPSPPTPPRPIPHQTHRSWRAPEVATTRHARGRLIRSHTEHSHPPLAPAVAAVTELGCTSRHGTPIRVLCATRAATPRAEPDLLGGGATSHPRAAKTSPASSSPAHPRPPLRTRTPQISPSSTVPPAPARAHG